MNKTYSPPPPPPPLLENQEQQHQEEVDMMLMCHNISLAVLCGAPWFTLRLLLVDRGEGCPLHLCDATSSSSSSFSAFTPSKKKKPSLFSRVSLLRDTSPPNTVVVASCPHTFLIAALCSILVMQRAIALDKQRYRRPVEKQEEGISTTIPPAINTTTTSTNTTTTTTTSALFSATTSAAKKSFSSILGKATSGKLLQSVADGVRTLAASQARVMRHGISTGAQHLERILSEQLVSRLDQLSIAGVAQVKRGIIDPDMPEPLRLVLADTVERFAALGVRRMHAQADLLILSPLRKRIHISRNSNGSSSSASSSSSSSSMVPTIAKTATTTTIGGSATNTSATPATAAATTTSIHPASVSSLSSSIYYHYCTLRGLAHLYSQLRATVLYTLSPYDRSAWSCFRDPKYWMFTLVGLIPHPIVSNLWWLLLYMWKDRHDAWQLSEFIVSFETAKFISNGILGLLYGSGLYFLCTSFPTDRPCSRFGPSLSVLDGCLFMFQVFIVLFAYENLMRLGKRKTSNRKGSTDPAPAPRGENNLVAALTGGRGALGGKIGEGGGGGFASFRTPPSTPARKGNRSSSYEPGRILGSSRNTHTTNDVIDDDDDEKNVGVDASAQNFLLGASSFSSYSHSTNRKELSSSSRNNSSRQRGMSMSHALQDHRDLRTEKEQQQLGGGRGEGYTTTVNTTTTTPPRSPRLMASPALTTMSPWLRQLGVGVILPLQQQSGSTTNRHDSLITSFSPSMPPSSSSSSAAFSSGNHHTLPPPPPPPLPPSSSPSLSPSSSPLLLAGKVSPDSLNTYPHILSTSSDHAASFSSASAASPFFRGSQNPSTTTATTSSSSSFPSLPRKSRWGLLSQQGFGQGSWLGKGASQFGFHHGGALQIFFKYQATIALIGLLLALWAALHDYYFVSPLASTSPSASTSTTTMILFPALFWLRTLYGLLSFPFVLFKVPWVMRVYVTDRPTGYDQDGRTRSCVSGNTTTSSSSTSQ